VLSVGNGGDKPRKETFSGTRERLSSRKRGTPNGSSRGVHLPGKKTLFLRKREEGERV